MDQARPTPRKRPDDLPAGTMCERCGEQEASGWWVGSGGAMAMIHGMKSAWCERCVVEKQLEHALERAKLIPELEARLKDLGGAFTGQEPDPFGRRLVPPQSQAST